eukprot:TRINITY_DN9161_c0_g1_i2.p1 TRINITY_DN9161_c0_g1~~TRINITY_DN9161_c0_g1_i2.p1  ORF type:complete len:735 (-),score=174.56 TRINITY_DN9161_c0_g1_i2:128-2332(-)
MARARMEKISGHKRQHDFIAKYPQLGASLRQCWEYLLLRDAGVEALRGRPLCLRLQEAHWFYTDSLFAKQKRDLPKLSQFVFFGLMLEHCEALREVYASKEQYSDLMAEWRRYLNTVSRAGAVLMDESMTRCLMVQTWKSSCWTFPSGKVEEGDDELQTALREVQEETGLAVSEMTDAATFITATFKDNSEVNIHVKLFVMVGVPQNIRWEVSSAQEIQKMAWVELSRLPGWWGPGSKGSKLKFHETVSRFVRQLKNFVDGKQLPAKAEKEGSAATEDMEDMEDGHENSLTRLPTLELLPTTQAEETPPPTAKGTLSPTLEDFSSPLSGNAKSSPTRNLEELAMTSAYTATAGASRTMDELRPLPDTSSLLLTNTRRGLTLTREYLPPFVSSANGFSMEDLPSMFARKNSGFFDAARIMSAFDRGLTSLRQQQQQQQQQQQPAAASSPSDASSAGEGGGAAAEDLSSSTTKPPPGPAAVVAAAAKTASSSPFPKIIFWEIALSLDDRHALAKAWADAQFGPLLHSLAEGMIPLSDLHTTLLYYGVLRNPNEVPRNHMGLTPGRASELNKRLPEVDGRAVTLEVDSIVTDGTVAVAPVKFVDWPDPACANVYPHITLARISCVKPQQSNELLARKAAMEDFPGSLATWLRAIGLERRAETIATWCKGRPTCKNFEAFLTQSSMAAAQIATSLQERDYIVRQLHEVNTALHVIQLPEPLLLKGRVRPRRALSWRHE